MLVYQMLRASCTRVARTFWYTNTLALIYYYPNILIDKYASLALFGLQIDVRKFPVTAAALRFTCVY
jgi:hypothetical protein